MSLCLLIMLLYVVCAVNKKMVGKKKDKLVIQKIKLNVVMHYHDQ